MIIVAIADPQPSDALKISSRPTTTGAVTGRIIAARSGTKF
jgi:hypothetical protein